MSDKNSPNSYCVAKGKKRGVMTGNVEEMVMVIKRMIIREIG
jgi:hypothetical protein